MSSSKTEQLVSPISIVGQIVDGSIQIDTIEEFKSILELFPEDPELLKVYSDLLHRKKMHDDAVDSYARTADLFMESGMMLQAIASKNLEWKNKPPDDISHAHQFFSMIHKHNFTKSPLNDFFQKLSYPELFAIISNFNDIRLSPGSIFKKNHKGEKDLYLVVSGALRETTYTPVKVEQETLHRKSTLNLYENDYFGNFYPFEEKDMTHAYVEAITQVDMIRLPKKDLREISKKYQDIELALNDLRKCRPELGQNRKSRYERHGIRHYLPTEVSLKIFSRPEGSEPLTIDAYSLDLSIGGICVVLDATAQNIALFSRTIQNAGVQVTLPVESMSLTVSGTIVWSKSMHIEHKKTQALGIKFEKMSPKVRGMVFTFADSICSKKDFASFSPIDLFKK